MPVLEEYISEAELAQELGISQRTLRRWRRAMVDFVPSLKVGARRLYRRSAVADWLRRREAGGNPRGQ